MSPRRTVKASIETAPTLPIDSAELAVMAAALELDTPSKLSPLSALMRSTDGAPSRSWTEIRGPVGTMTDSTFADHVAPMVAPDRILEIRATAFEGVPSPLRLHSSRRCGPDWAGIRPGAERDHELVAPYRNADIDDFVSTNLSMSIASDEPVPWDALSGDQLVFFCALVDAWRMRFHLASAQRQAVPQPVTFEFDDIVAAQRDGRTENDRRWLLTALAETFGLLVHPRGGAAITLPMLSVEQLKSSAQQWADRGWLEVITPGPNPVLQLGRPVYSAVMTFLAWSKMVVLHDVEVISVDADGVSADEELMLFVVTGPVIWTFVAQDLTSAASDMGDVSFRMQSVTVDQGVEAAQGFLQPNDVTLTDDVYAPAPADAPAPTAASASAPAAPAAPWAPTHTVPTIGLPAWTSPDASQAQAATLDPALDVQVAEQHENGWARIVCSNGWSAWVDGRLLVPR